MTAMMVGKGLVLCALMGGATAIAAGQAAEEPAQGHTPKFVKFDTTGMFQGEFMSAGDNVFVAGQPTEKALREMKARGVTTVVNLRSPQEMVRVPIDEPAIVKRLGMNYVYLPMRGGAEMPFTPAAVKSLAAAINGTDGKVLLHCTVAWRASHLFAAYLVTEKHVPLEEVLATMGLVVPEEIRMMPGLQPLEEFLGHPLPEFAKFRSP